MNRLIWLALASVVLVAGCGVQPPLQVATDSVPSASLKQGYSVQLKAVGSNPPFIWTLVSGSLPPGVRLSSTTGIISGTPQSEGEFDFAVQVSEVAEPTLIAQSPELKLKVKHQNGAKTLTLQTTSLSGGAVQSPYSARLSATGGNLPYTWSVAAGSLPPGVTLNVSTGVFAGTPTVSGQFSFTAEVQDSSTPAEHASTALAINIASATPTALSTSSAGVGKGVVGQAYAGSFSANGGTSPYTWTLQSGSLPPGVAFNGSTGSLSGMPTTAGSYTLIVQAKDSSATPQTASASASIPIGPAATPLQITSTSLPAAHVGSAYSATLTAEGGAPPYSWSILSGSLPAGLSLNGSTGTISGTPSAVGTASFEVSLTDSAGASVDPPMSITVNSAGPSISANYTSRTDSNFQAYPSTIPNVGNLTGANTIVTPSDFNNPIIRVTDVNTANGTHKPGLYALDSSAEVNFMNKNDDRFFVTDNGGNVFPFIWDPVATQATRMYVSSFPSTNGIVLPLAGNTLYGFPSWSFTQAYIAYTLEVNQATNSIAVFSYDFTGTTTPPSRALVVDLSTCVPAIAGLGINWNDGVSVSGDDQTFGLTYSTNGQGGSGAIYAITWNRTNGCRTWNTSTGAVTGNDGVVIGTISDSVRMTIHNGRISKDGQGMKVGSASCLGGSCTGDYSTEAIWNVTGLTVNISHFNSTYVWNCGHNTTGYGVYYNACGATNADFYAMFLPAYGDLDTAQYGTPQLPEILGIRTGALLPNPISNHPFDLHASWANNSGDNTAPIFLTTWNGQLAPRAAWDNEVIGVSPTGDGTVYRFAHIYNTNLSQFFETAHAIGSVSQSGNWFAWASDWNGTLGNTDLSASSCTIGSNCRGDVFMVKLQ